MSATNEARVLFLDDETEVLDEYEDLLLVENIRSITKSDPKEALLALFDHPSIQLVVTDLRMPNLNGVDFTRTVKTSLPLRKIEFIWMTGFVDGGYIQECDLPIAILTKPVDSDVLKKTILENLKK